MIEGAALDYTYQCFLKEAKYEMEKSQFYLKNYTGEKGTEMKYTKILA